MQKLPFTPTLEAPNENLLKALEESEIILPELRDGKSLDIQYRDHKLIDNKRFQKCRECHIEPRLATCIGNFQK